MEEDGWGWLTKYTLIVTSLAFKHRIDTLEPSSGVPSLNENTEKSWV